MAKTHAFGRLLAETRRDQGYPTPYAFFRGRGARRGLGLTFPNYLSLERGENLPKGWRLERLLGALGLLPHSTAWRRLVRIYLVELVGSEALVAGLEGPAAPDQAPSALRLAESASKQALGRMKVQLDVRQYAVLAKDAAAYACHVVLCNTEGWMEAKELAALAGAPAASVRRALAALASAGMVKVSGSRARSAFEEDFLEPPAPTAALASIYARLAAHRGAWLKDHGAVLHAPYLLLRARRSDMERYQEHLTEVVKMSAVFGDIRRTADSDMYIVEGKVTRLFRRPGKAA